MAEMRHAEALTEALVAIRRSSPDPASQTAWQEIDQLMRSLLGRPLSGPDVELATAWAGAQTEQPDPVILRELALALDRRAARDPALRSNLRQWLERRALEPDSAGVRPATAHPDAGGHANCIGGSAQIVGTVVQARSVHGGIHYHSAAPLPPRVPRQLPPGSAHFVDRREDLRALDELRQAHQDGSPQVIAISGLAGIGKTALAVHWLRSHVHDFPDGQLFASLGGFGPTGPVETGEVLDQFLRALGIVSVPVELTERIALWRSMTAELRLAVMLDDAYSAAQVRPLFPSSGASLVVVTARRQLTGLVVDGAELHQLAALAPTAAVELLRRSGGGTRVAREPDAAADIAARCAYLPLALCLAAARLAARPREPVNRVAAALHQGQGPLEMLQLEGHAVIRSALNETYQVLPTAAARTYRYLGLLPIERYDHHLVAAVCATSMDDTDRELGTLIEAHLLEDLGPDTLRFHDLVRAHARHLGEIHESDATHEEVLRRFVEWCLATATATEELISPSHRTLPRSYTNASIQPVHFETDAAALAWLDTHRATLLAAMRHCAAAGWDETCWQLVDSAWGLFLRLRPAEMWVESHTLGLAAARRLGDREAEGRMLTSGGNGLRNADRPEEAADWYAQALRLAEEDGDLRQQAQALNGLGNAHRAGGRLDQATQFFTRALEKREEIGYHRGAALSRLCLGEAALARGDHDQAREFLTRARTQLLAEGDGYDAARALAYLGRTRAAGGDSDGGDRQLRQACVEFQEAGSDLWEARTSEMLGQNAYERGSLEHARMWYERAIELYRALRPAEADRLSGRLRHL